MTFSWGQALNTLLYLHPTALSFPNIRIRGAKASKHPPKYVILISEDTFGINCYNLTSFSSCYKCLAATSQLQLQKPNCFIHEAQKKLQKQKKSRLEKADL